jgi:hypothetical protein
MVVVAAMVNIANEEQDTNVAHMCLSGRLRRDVIELAGDKWQKRDAAKRGSALPRQEGPSTTGLASRGCRHTDAASIPIDSCSR